MTHDPSPPELNQIATDYFLRRREPDWSETDEAQLKQWLKASPHHTAIYAHVARTWASLAKVPRPVLASDAAAQAQPDGTSAGTSMPESAVVPARAGEFAWTAPAAGTRGTRQDERPPVAHGWLAHIFGRLAPVMLVLAVLGGTAGWYWWDTTPGYRQTIAHTAPQPHTLDLPDGSQIVVNTGSAIEVRYYPRRREVVLSSGEAFFQVMPDAQRPFTVDTGPSRVTVVGTAFNVRAAPPAMQVKVQEGIVQVQPDRTDPRRQAVLLRAGQGISIQEDGSQYAAIPTDTDTVGDWREGQLIFRQTPLQTVVEELQRYTRHPIRLDRDQRLIALPVTGSAITHNPETFLQALPQLLPVRVQQRGGEWVISRR